jgi:hypothetical protein
MKYWFLGVVLACGFALAAPPTQVQAYSDSGSSDSGSSGKRSPTGTTGGSVPELDAAAAGGAIVLLLGGVAYFVSRRRDADAS